MVEATTYSKTVKEYFDDSYKVTISHSFNRFISSKVKV